jgi:hypothetical protein
MLRDLHSEDTYLSECVVGVVWCYAGHGASISECRVLRTVKHIVMSVRRR